MHEELPVLASRLSLSFSVCHHDLGHRRFERSKVPELFDGKYEQ